MVVDLKCTNVFERNWDAIHARNEDGSRKYKYIVNTGSSRSSKTISLSDIMDLYARANANKRLTVWRDTKTDCKKTVLNDTLKRLKTTGRYMNGFTFNKTESIFQYYNDSTFEIHGTDDEETVHGLTQDAAWLNEPYKISKNTFDQIDQRTSDFILIDWNPKKAHWINDVVKDSKAIVIKSTFQDNPFCPKEQRDKILSYQPVSMCSVVLSKAITEHEAKSYNIETNILAFTEYQIEELVRCIENERKNSASKFNWSVYGLGEKAEKPNRIFNWTEIPDTEFEAINTTSYYGCDWGAVDPWGIVKAKYLDGCLYLHEINYESENEIRARLSPVQMSQINASDEGIVSWLFNEKRIETTKYVICDNNRRSKILALRNAGWEYSVAAEKPPGSILDGIDLLNNLKVFYTSSSKNLSYEQENYSRQVDRFGNVLEEPEDKDNHLIDPTRYIALTLQKEGIISKI